jgi:HMG (high mobility group) box
MSAFLKFSQKRRSMVKERNPDMSNTDVSRLLGEMWRNASAAERAPYVEQEERERAAYKAEIQKWREEQAKLDASTRTSHLDVAMDVADDKHASVLVHQQQQQHAASRDMYSDPANAFASYEPISLHGTDEAAPFLRSGLAPREVFRSYSSGSSSHRAHASQPRPVDEQRPRSADAANMYSYRFGGLYSHHEHEMYYPPPRNYRGTLMPAKSAISSAVPALYSPIPWFYEMQITPTYMWEWQRSGRLRPSTQDVPRMVLHTGRTHTTVEAGIPMRVYNIGTGTTTTTIRRSCRLR